MARRFSAHSRVFVPFHRFLLALGLLAVIWYLFHSRGGHGGFKAIGWLLLYALVGFVVNMIVAAVVLMVLHVTGIRAIG